MSNSRNRWLVFLLCLNAVLITAVVLSNLPPSPAYAQTRQRSSSGDYLLIPGKVSNNAEVLWVVKTSTNQINTCRFNKRTGFIEYGELLNIPFEQLTTTTEFQDRPTGRR